MEYDNKAIRRQLMAPLNHQLSEIFQLIDYKTPFEIRMSKHAVERLEERITKADANRLGVLLKRIIRVGICELLYFQTRYMNGESVGYVEFVIDDLIVPITFVGDYVVLRTIMFEGENRMKQTHKIDLSNSRFK